MIKKLKEPSTWIGLVALISLFGVALKPELQAEIVKLGVGLGGILAIWLGEGQ